jgi:uncharacterized protein
MTPSSQSRLANNVMHFARVLRYAGLPIGPAKVLDALHALEVTGIERRDDFYWTLAAVFLQRREQQSLFDQAFKAFWRDPGLLVRVLDLPPLALPGARQSKPAQLSRRVAESLAHTGLAARRKTAEAAHDQDGMPSYSASEALREKDFEQMSEAEVAVMKRALAELKLPIKTVKTRRWQASDRGARLDWRATIRAGLRNGGETLELKRRARTSRTPPLVVLCDISGSMDRYTRLFLHFAHALCSDGQRLHAFLFGTRLTNVTRYLAERDVDAALAEVASRVADWAGGTRIGPCIAEFNLRWSRRLLAQNATVLLVSDGLDRDDPALLGRAMERLGKSCRRLIWLNPLLRYAGFEAKAAGVRAMLPHVHAFLPVHNLESILQLGRALSRLHESRPAHRPHSCK